jgi:uncharacterized membrane protein YhaH (DUF805 family)
VEWHFETLRKYAVFAGRARRREYWMFELWNTLVLVALIIIDLKISAPGHNERAVLTGLYLLATAIPGLAAWFADSTIPITADGRFSLA